MNIEHPLKSIYESIDNGEPHDRLNTIPEFPRIIETEITNHCNFQCIMCKTGTGQAKRTRGYMTEDCFQKLLSEASDKKAALKFVGQGESTLHPQFLKWVKMAKEAGIICHLTTNGSMFTESYMQEIINSGLDSVKFSFQGVTSEGYRTLRKKNDFEELLAKINKLFKLRGVLTHPFITVGTSVLKETEEEITAFKNRCEPFCDKVEIGVTTLEYIDLSCVHDKQERQLLERMKVSQGQSFRRYKCCHQVFDVITIHWNGNICACCADNDEVMVLGNINNNSLKECWNSEKEKIYRSILAEREYEKLPLCKDCYDIYEWTYQK